MTEQNWRDQLANPMFAAAVECARHDLPVYPARPRSKQPLWRGWQRGATTKVEHLANIWRNEPNANIGISCRRLLVLDPDSPRGEDAIADLGLPTTTTVKTRRGLHRYFLGSAPTKPNLLPDVEARGTGAGVLGPGSIHPSGFEYAWEIPPWEVPPVGIPPVLAELIWGDQGTTLSSPPTDGRIYRGTRHIALVRIGGSLRGVHGIPNVEPTLHAINKSTCVPPLPASHIKPLAKVIERWNGPPPWLADHVTFCFKDERLSGEARIVLDLLVHHANLEGKCFPSLKRLASMAKMSRRRILRAVAELESTNRIEVTRGNRSTPNHYQLLAGGVTGNNPGSYSSGAEPPPSPGLRDFAGTSSNSQPDHPECHGFTLPPVSTNGNHPDVAAVWDFRHGSALPPVAELEAKAEAMGVELYDPEEEDA
jgi:hypothetical protein